MVVIEKAKNVNFKSNEPIVALDFQPHPVVVESDNIEKKEWWNVERLAAGGGCGVKIWLISERLKHFKELNEINKFQEGCEDGIIQSNCVCQLNDHSPQYIVCVRWSLCGTYLASCDNRRVMIFSYSSLDFKNKSEAWKCVFKFSDLTSDIFDLTWFGEEQIVLGGIDGIKIWDLQTQSFSTSASFCCGFVKGLCSYSRKYIAAQSNDKTVSVWEKDTRAKSVSSSVVKSSNEIIGFQNVIRESALFALGPSDIPYHRRGSFDPGGKMVVFPYGERGNQCFGVLLVLSTNEYDRETHIWRFRGHMSRVNCVSFSRGVWHSFPSEENDFKGQTFTLYVQASLDGALSAWKVIYAPDNIPSRSMNAFLSSKCLFVLTPKFIDEQASVTDMAWTTDGMTLAVGADDGSITFIKFAEAELRGMLLTNEKIWAKKGCIPVPPDPSLLKNLWTIGDKDAESRELKESSAICSSPRRCVADVPEIREGASSNGFNFGFKIENTNVEKGKQESSSSTFNVVRRHITPTVIRRTTS